MCVQVCIERLMILSLSLSVQCSAPIDMMGLNPISLYTKCIFNSLEMKQVKGIQINCTNAQKRKKTLIVELTAMRTILHISKWHYFNLETIDNVTNIECICILLVPFYLHCSVFFLCGQSTLVYFTLQARAEQIFSDTYALTCAYNMMRFGHDVKYLTKCLKCNPAML